MNSVVKILGLSLLIFSYSLQAAPGKTSFESRGMKLEREKMGNDLGPIWGLVFLPSGEILMTIKSGELKRFDPKTKAATTIPGAPKVAVHGQGGLLDIALSPKFKDDKKVYLTYSKEVAKSNYVTALGVGTYDGKELKDFRDIFVAQGKSSKGEHFGSRLVIDPDSTIWMSIGERGDRNNAQRLDNHFGKILRLTADGKAHPDNPFVGRKDALPEIYSYGHRNPQGLARHHLNQELWETEHGPRGGDEINRIRKGLNYGWPKATYGREYYGPKIGETKVEGTEPPLYQWTPSIAPSGMVVYDGDALPAWKGIVFSGALALTHLNLVEIKKDGKAVEERLFVEDGQRVRDVQQGPSGELWYSTDDGSLYRIQKATAGAKR